MSSRQDYETPIYAWVELYSTFSFHHVLCQCAIVSYPSLYSGIDYSFGFRRLLFICVFRSDFRWFRVFV